MSDADANKCPMDYKGLHHWNYEGLANGKPLYRCKCGKAMMGRGIAKLKETESPVRHKGGNER